MFFTAFVLCILWLFKLLNRRPNNIQKTSLQSFKAQIKSPAWNNPAQELCVKASLNRHFRHRFFSTGHFWYRGWLLTRESTVQSNLHQRQTFYNSHFFSYRRTIHSYINLSTTDTSSQRKQPLKRLPKSLRNVTSLHNGQLQMAFTKPHVLL